MQNTSARSSSAAAVPEIPVHGVGVTIEDQAEVLGRTERPSDDGSVVAPTELISVALVPVHASHLSGFPKRCFQFRRSSSRGRGERGSRPQLRTFLGRAGRLRCVNTRVTPRRSHAHAHDRNPDLLRGGRSPSGEAFSPVGFPARLAVHKITTPTVRILRIYTTESEISAREGAQNRKTNWITEAAKISTSSSTSTRLVPQRTSSAVPRGRRR